MSDLVFIEIKKGVGKPTKCIWRGRPMHLPRVGEFVEVSDAHAALCVKEVVHRLGHISVVVEGYDTDNELPEVNGVSEEATPTDD